MPHKNILIVENSSCQQTVYITPGKDVSFHPVDSDTTVRVRFQGPVPFEGWTTKKWKIGDKGKPLKGKVLKDLKNGDTFEYEPEGYEAQSLRKRISPLVNPQLVVDGGEPAPSGKKRAKPSKKKVARKK